MERVEGGATRTVIDEWVKPAHAVTDHLTAVSGVTATHLETATHTVSSVQDLMLTHVGVRDVLVGHSLANDLKVGALSPPPDSQTERAPCSTRGGFLVPRKRMLCCSGWELSCVRVFEPRTSLAASTSVSHCCGAGC